MVNPGAFRGQRKEFLMAEKETYAAGMEGGFAADALAQIQRRYFKRFPVELGHFEEPSPEFLASVDDNAPDPDPVEPDPEKLTPDAYLDAIKQADHRKDVIRYRKAQIKRWLAYQYMKDQDLDPKESGANNPFNSLIFAITGKEAGRPRRRTAVNVWRKTQRVSIEARVKELAISESVTKDRLAALRDRVARDTFNNLSASEQEHWKQQAAIESDFALEEWKRTVLSEPPNSIKDYQIAIQGLVRISKPFLDFVCKATGWKASLITGGPEPAQGGKLNVISIHSGTTPGDMKLNWGRVHRARFKKDVVSCFGDFLKMCYTPDECRARALLSSEGFEGLVEEECNQEGVELDMIDSAPSTTNAGMTTTSSSRPSHISVPTPFSSNTTHNIPPNAARKTVLYSSGRKEPSYKRVPPVRKNPSNIDLSKRPVNQGTAPLRPVTSTTQPSASQSIHDASHVPTFHNTISSQSSSGTFAAGAPFGPTPVLPPDPATAMSHGSTPFPSRGPTPFPSRGPTPFPSRGPTPFPSRGPTPAPSPGPTPAPSRGLTPPLPLPPPPPHAPIAPTPVSSHTPAPTPSCGPPPGLCRDLTPPSSGRLRDTRQHPPYQPETMTLPQTDDTQGLDESRQGKKRKHIEEMSSCLSSDADVDLRPQKKLRSHRTAVPLNVAAASDSKGSQGASPHAKAVQKRKSAKSGSSRPPRKSNRQIRETQQAVTTVVPNVLQVKAPKKRRKSTGTWIVSDDEGGWRDQDGNPCDLPSDYRHM